MARYAVQFLGILGLLCTALLILWVNSNLAAVRIELNSATGELANYPLNDTGTDPQRLQCRRRALAILMRRTKDGGKRTDHLENNLDFAKRCWQESMAYYMSFPVSFSFGSHVLPLLASVWVTDGAVCELGSGWFSTPMLHRVAQDQDRFLLTADSNAGWLKYFTIFATEFHHLYYVNVAHIQFPVPEGFEQEKVMTEVDTWAKLGEQAKWGVIFVDHAPGYQRYIDLLRLRNRSEIFLVHDTDRPSLRGYSKNGVEANKTLQTFRYKYVIGDKWSARHAHVLSDKRGDLVEVIGQLCDWGMELLQSTFHGNPQIRHRPDVAKPPPVIVPSKPVTNNSDKG